MSSEDLTAPRLADLHRSRMVAARSWPLCAGPRTTTAGVWPSMLGALRDKSREDTAALCIAHLAESQWESAAQLPKKFLVDASTA